MKKFLLVLLLIVSIHSFSQTETGNLETYLQEKINHIPGETGDNYTVPTDTQLTTWSNCVNAILSNDIVSARTFAEMLNYEIVTYRDTEVYVNRTVYILEEKANQTNYWGTYVFDNNSIRFPMVLQAPHSIFDFNTGKQAIYCFVRLEAKFLFLNGTQRCNNNLASTCSGTTSVCSGSSDAFKVSDLAHNTNSVWQKTTEIIYNTISESLFIQLHGFSKENSDPYVIISNGTNQNPAGKDYAAEIKNYLLSEDNNLTFKVAHLDDWTRLTGFTNSQGRFINNSTDACKTAASNASGRFIHIEQEKSKLREDETVERAPSVRASLGIYERSQSNALLNNRKKVSIEDVIEVLYSVIAHRLKLKPSVKYLVKPEQFINKQVKELFGEEYTKGDGP